MARYQIVTIRPAGFVHSHSWDEALDSVRYALLALGKDVTLQVNHFDSGRTPIIFGAHHLEANHIAQLAPDSIIYNFEQLLPGYPWFQERYLRLLNRHQVWDFSPVNAQFLWSSKVAETAIHVPVGYVPQWTRVARADEDVDVLFFGLLSDRRKVILDQLAAQGVKVKLLTNVFGDERDAWISRAKVVLNMRLRDQGMFESLRVNYLMANKKAIVTEAPAPGDWMAPLLPGVHAVPYEGLVEACQALIADAAAREALGAEAQRLFTSAPFRMTHILRTVMSGKPRVLDAGASPAPAAQG